MINAPNAIRNDLAGAPLDCGEMRERIRLQILTKGLFGRGSPNGCLLPACSHWGVQILPLTWPLGQLFGTWLLTMMQGFGAILAQILAPDYLGLTLPSPCNAFFWL